MEPVLSICCPRNQRSNSRVCVFALAWLDFAFGLHLPLGGRQRQQALKSEAAVDGNRKEVADRVASFPARLLIAVSRKTVLAVIPLVSTNAISLFLIVLIHLCSVLS